MFDLGQLGLIPFSPRDDASIIESIQRSDIVINLIGKHYETKHLVPTRRADGKLSRINYDFNEVHCDIARRIARLTKQAGIETLIHVSALSADANSTSAWSRSKAAGELAVREEFPDAIIVKPSTIFGPEDRFLNLIATINADSPVVPIVNNGDTLVQPVYSLDVAKALHTIVQNHRSFKGATFQLTGPAEYSYREIVEFVQDVSTVTKPIMAVPDSGMNFAGKVFDTFIAPIHTPDMVAQMNEDCVAIEGKGYKTLEDLGIEPSSMDKYSFDFLHRFRPGGHFTMVQGYH